MANPTPIPQAVGAAAVPATPRDLHAAIMNLPCCPYRPEPEFALGYKMGHKDARHAAAELALSASPSTASTSAPAEPEAPTLADARRYQWLRKHKHYALLVDFGFSHSQVEHWSNEQNAVKLDAAVDAARRGAPDAAPAGEPAALTDKELRARFNKAFTGGNGTELAWSAFRGGYRMAERELSVIRNFRSTPTGEAADERASAAPDVELLRRALYYLEADMASRIGVRGLEDMVTAGDHPVVADLRKRLGGSARFPAASPSGERPSAPAQEGSQK